VTKWKKWKTPRIHSFGKRTSANFPSNEGDKRPALEPQSART